MVRSRKKRLVIIGNSAAGISAILSIRRRAPDIKILLIDKEPYPFYSRVITPYFIMDKRRKEDSLFLWKKSLYKELNVKTIFGKEVKSVDTRQREILLDDGKREGFDALLIATGGSAIKPQIKDSNPEDIMVLRTMNDAKNLKKIKPKLSKVLFTGGGLITLQTLQSLYKLNCEYSLVIKSHRILSQTLDPEASEMVERNLKKMGINILKGRDINLLRKMNNKMIAILDNGYEIETDLVFAGKGVRPNTDLVVQSEIEVKRGIIVDDYLQTNVEGIYAAGDVAQAPDFFSGERVNYGLWISAIEQGDIAGKNMLGEKEPYPGNLRMNVSRIFGVSIASIGDLDSERICESLIKRDEKNNIYRKICLDKNGIIIGAVLINQIEDLGIIHNLIRKRKDISFLKTGSIWKSPLNYGLIYKNILTGILK